MRWWLSNLNHQTGDVSHMPVIAWGSGNKLSPGKQGEEKGKKEGSILASILFSSGLEWKMKSWSPAKWSYIYRFFFSGEKSPNIYCELTLFRHGLTEEKRRERSSVAILGFKKIAITNLHWKRKEVNELTMWNPLVIIRCKLVKICWRLGEGVNGGQREQSDWLAYMTAWNIQNVLLYHVTFKSFKKSFISGLCSFLGSWIQLQCVHVSVHASPHHQHFSPTSLASHNPIQFDSYPEGVSGIQFKGSEQRLVEVQSYKTSSPLH